MPLNANATRFPNFYAWTVVHAWQPVGPTMTFDLLTMLPAGEVTPWEKPVTAPAGIRLADIDPMFSPSWFADCFREALDDKVLEIPPAPDFIPSRALTWGEENGILVPNSADDNPTAQMLAEADRLMEHLAGLQT